MSAIAIYLEGGGQKKDSKADLRTGMGEFLKSVRDNARAAGCHWKVVPCGSRNDAFGAFSHATQTDSEAINILLVDSEEPLIGGPAAHLTARDGWDLSGVDPDRVHVMACVMETWIVADPEGLAGYYRQGFNRKSLPAAIDLETVRKTDVNKALTGATRATQKGEYHKTRHAPDLLERIDPVKVRTRCQHCDRLFGFLMSVV